ncbi:TonB-dependent receptor [Sphingomonas rubra]|uniref:TonB-dependent Receptor Plug Domain n=1 Tax=Sphingomonas rubra TaxID=634430 RepID=A0A1I5UVH0_9SPHN|nr:TonB-dependent receptor [Sphingomonas rubra]SFP99198.1 TonB-dependent Receptor Plug Domain [Sphingomonas rubra]
MTGRKIVRAALIRGVALRPIALIACGVAASTFSAAPATAQDYQNVTASGRVRSTNGEGIANATVTVTSDAQGFTRTTTTDASGTFRVAQLPAGSYTFNVSAPGFTAYNETGVAITLQRAANDFTLQPESVAEGEEIVVTAGRVQVADFNRNTVGTVVELGELATRVPVARDISSVVQLSPGTTSGDTAFGNQPNISGSSVAENAFFINGLNTTNFRTQIGAVTIPFEFYQTVEIKNGGFQAEFGRATGGIVNAVSKSGSNEFHGGILFNWEPDDLLSDAPNTLVRDNDARELDRQDFIAQLSGPIIKDKLFFYALYNARNVTSATAVTAFGGGTLANPTIVGSQYFREKSDSPYYAFKVDFTPFDGQRLEGTFFDTRNLVQRDVFGTVASGRRYNPTTNDPGNYDSTTIFRTGGINFVGRYTGTFTDWLTISGAYGQNRDRDTIETSSPDLASVVDGRGGLNVSIGNPIANNETNFDRREFFRGDIDVFVNLLGSHHFRGGYDRENLTTRIVTQSNGIGQITLLDGSPTDEFGITTGQYAQIRSFVNGGTFRSKNEAYYIQDDWSLFGNRINLQLGVRNDRFLNRTIDGTAYYRSGDQWGPRLGISGDPLGDGTTKAYGSFGRYFLPIAASTNNRLGGAELDQERFFRFSGLGASSQPILTTQLTPRNGEPCLAGLAGSCLVRNDGAAGDPTSLIAGNLESQSVDEYILGIERRFGKFRVNVFGTYKNLNQSLEDSAIDPAVRAFCNANNLNRPNADGQTCQTIFSGTHQYVLINPGNNAVVTLSDPINGETGLRTIELSAEALQYPRAVRRYRAMTFQVQRDFDGRWGGEFSYTYSSLVGNTEGGVRSDNGQDDTGATVDFDLPGLADGTFGYSPNHRRHNFKLFGSYAPFEWLTLGANAQVTSPRKFGCLGTVPASRDPDASALYGPSGTYCNLNSDGSVRTTPAAAGEVLPPRQIVRRGTAFNSDWLYSLNLDATVKVPTDTFDGFFRVSVLNVFDTQQQLDFQEIGTTNGGAPRADYGAVNAYQAPRSVRLQFGVNF